MDSVALAFEALKFARDWATWLVGLDIATIGGLFSLLVAKERVLRRVDMTVEHNRGVDLFDGRYLLLAGVLCLATSASWAGILLAGIPDIAVRIAEYPEGSIFLHEIPFPFPGPLSIGIPLWVPMYMQNMAFAAGIFLVVIYLWAILIESAPKPESGD